MHSTRNTTTAAITKIALKFEFSASGWLKMASYHTHQGISVRMEQHPSEQHFSKAALQVFVR